jgi:hypothetical protein
MRCDSISATPFITANVLNEGSLGRDGKEYPFFVRSAAALTPAVILFIALPESEYKADPG